MWLVHASDARWSIRPPRLRGLPDRRRRSLVSLFTSGRHPDRYGPEGGRRALRVCIHGDLDQVVSATRQRRSLTDEMSKRRETADGYACRRARLLPGLRPQDYPQVAINCVAK